MLIYKILLPDEWAQLVEKGKTAGAPIDLADGFIHFSTAEQVRETAAKHFAGAGDLVLAAVEAAPLGQDLKWEVSRGEALFPHLYRALSLSDVAWTATLEKTAAGHVFPALPEPAEKV
ncbi:MAG: DUF952 domain-containing protein [Pseudomonadota bacterium]